MGWPSPWGPYATASAKRNKTSLVLDCRFIPRVLVLHPSCTWESPGVLLKILLPREDTPDQVNQNFSGWNLGRRVVLIFVFFNISLLHSTPVILKSRLVGQPFSQKNWERGGTSCHSECSHPLPAPWEPVKNVDSAPNWPTESEPAS